MGVVERTGVSRMALHHWIRAVAGHTHTGTHLAAWWPPCTSTYTQWIVPSLHFQNDTLTSFHNLIPQDLKRTSTHTHTCICTCITTARIGYVAPNQGVRQQKATRLVALLAAETPSSSPQLHGLLSAVGALIYGFARPMGWQRWGKPCVMPSEYLSWTLDHIIPHLHLVLSRWLAFVALVVPKHWEVH